MNRINKEKMIPNKKEKIWGLLLHLSFNMWEEYIWPDSPITRIRGYRPYMRLSEKLWKEVLEKMKEEGLNMAVITLGNAIQYESHPEIAVKGAWTVDRLRKEIKAIRKMGIEPIPSLNFSAGHDTWLQAYSHMVSTDEYYKICKDLIKEVSEIFNRPRFFHLGMDEEMPGGYDYVVVRQNDLWWGDFYFLMSEVEKRGVRPWIWSDYLWHHPDKFFTKMPKSVLQSNWLYDAGFDPQTQVDGYRKLEATDYDQMPTASNYGNGHGWESFDGQKSMINTVKFCKKLIEDSRLFGFLQTSWRPTIEEYREPILNSIQLAGEAKRWYEQNK